MLSSTLMHESTHMDNATDEGGVMAHLREALDNGEVDTDEALDIIEAVSGTNDYRRQARELQEQGKSPSELVADELMAHMLQAMSWGVPVESMTKNETLTNIISEANERREKVRTSGEEISQRSESADDVSRGQVQPSGATARDNETEQSGRGVRADDEGEVKTDRQGNPLNDDGTLKVERIASVDELTDEDFVNPSRNVELPALPKKVADAIGTDGKAVIIKKNIFERNNMRHGDVTPEQSKAIFNAALYNPDLYGQNQKAKKPYNWVLINTKDEQGKNRTVLLEVNPNKDNIEIVHWHFVDERGLEKIKRQAAHEDGQLLILPSVKEEVGALSDPMGNLSSGSKGTKKKRTKQGNTQKSEKPKAEKVEIDIQDVLSKPSGLKIGKSGKKAIDAYKFVERDKDNLKAHPAMGGVRYENGVAVATDGHVLVAVTTDYDKANEGKTINKSGEAITEGQFPHWRQILPRDGESVDKDAFLHTVDEAKAFVAEKKEPIVYIAIPSSNGNVMIPYDSARKIADVVGKAQNAGMFIGKVSNGVPVLTVTGDGVVALSTSILVDEELHGGKFFHVGEEQGARHSIRNDNQRKAAENADNMTGLFPEEYDVRFSVRLQDAIDETDTNPTEAQKASGNYKKGHIKFGGYDYTIENPKGSTRSGKDANGEEWKVTMNDTYGYIRGTKGKDGDHLDMFINDNADLDTWNGNVYVVDQVN